MMLKSNKEAPQGKAISVTEAPAGANPKNRFCKPEVAVSSNLPNIDKIFSTETSIPCKGAGSKWIQRIEKPVRFEVKQVAKADLCNFRFQEALVTHIAKIRDEKELEVIVTAINNFMVEKKIDVCFLMNEDELLDCLRDHENLKYEIERLKTRENELFIELENYKRQLAKMKGGKR